MTSLSVLRKLESIHNSAREIDKNQTRDFLEIRSEIQQIKARLSALEEARAEVR